jgi:hypothetical protein
MEDILTTLNHTTVEGLGFRQIKTPRDLGRIDTFIRGAIMISFDERGGVKAIVNGSIVPDIDLKKLKLFLNRP